MSSKLTTHFINDTIEVKSFPRPPLTALKSLFGGHSISYDIAEEIFKNLNCNDLTQARLVSRTWNAFILSSKPLHSLSILKSSIIYEKKIILEILQKQTHDKNKVAYKYKNYLGILIKIDFQKGISETETAINKYNLNYNLWIAVIREIAQKDLTLAYSIANKEGHEARTELFLEVLDIHLKTNFAEAKEKVLDLPTRPLYNDFKDRALKKVALIEAEFNLTEAKNTADLIDADDAKTITLLEIARIEHPKNYHLHRSIAKSFTNSYRVNCELLQIAEIDPSDNLSELKKSVYQNISNDWYWLVECLEIESLRNLDQSLKTALTVLDYNANLSGCPFKQALKNDPEKLKQKILSFPNNNDKTSRFRDKIIKKLVKTEAQTDINLAKETIKKINDPDLKKRSNLDIILSDPHFDLNKAINLLPEYEEEQKLKIVISLAKKDLESAKKLLPLIANQVTQDEAREEITLIELKRSPINAFKTLSLIQEEEKRSFLIYKIIKQIAKDNLPGGFNLILTMIDKEEALDCLQKIQQIALKNLNLYFT